MDAVPKSDTSDGERARRSPSLDAVVTGDDVSYNLNGQKLGRKGRDTRERILAACVQVMEDESDEQVTMSAVARRAQLRMTSLYNYFADITELLLAVLEPVMADAEDAFVASLRGYWPDDELAERSAAFLAAYHDFWSRNARLLHWRNSMADGGDQRMLIHRVRATQPLILMLVAQMSGDPDDPRSPTVGLATVMMTSIERVTTVSTDRSLTGLFGENMRRRADHYLTPLARLLELGIRDMRQKVAGDTPA